MRTIKLTNSNKRDAEVCMDVPKKPSAVKKVTKDGGELFSIKILKQNLAMSFESLASRYDDMLQMGKAIIDSDPEVDMEIEGRKLGGTRKIYLRPNGQIAYRVDMQQIIRDPKGNEKERRDFTKALSNVTGEENIVQWTGRTLSKTDAIRKFVFSRKYQIKHISGLTFDFLYAMAKELNDTNSLMYMGGGKKGKEPLIITQGGEAYHGFLEGRVKGETYVLILHLSNMEMKPAGL